MLGTLQSAAVTVVDEPGVPTIVPTLPLSVMTVLSVTVQVTTLVTSVPTVLPTVAFAKNVICWFCGALDALSVSVRSLTTGHTVTVAVVVAVMAPSLALIVVVPMFVAAEAAVATPLVCPIDATDESEEDQIDLLVTFCVLPSLNVPVAVI